MPEDEPAWENIWPRIFTDSPGLKKHTDDRKQLFGDSQPLYF
jgi:hypothetical protein